MRGEMLDTATNVFRPARLLLVVDSLDAGGAERYVVGLATALTRKRYHVEVACSVGGVLSGALEEAGVRVHVLGGDLVKRRVSLRYAARLRSLVKHGAFDLVHAHIYASAAASALATAGTRVPLVLTEHTEAPWRSRRARWVSRWAYARAAHVVAVSTPIERLLVTCYGVPRARVTFVPTAITADSRAPAPALGVDGRDGPLVACVARLQPEKGIDVFLCAAARVSSLLPTARFLVVGDGPLRHELEALAERLGLGERVEFLGLRRDARALMALFDVIAISSVTDGTPLVALEAAQVGVPVVASAVGGIPDLLRHEREALLVPARDPTALAEALLRVLRDQSLARRLAEAGRRRALDFRHERMIEQVEAVYAVALAAPSRDLDGRAPYGAPELVPDRGRLGP